MFCAYTVRIHVCINTWQHFPLFRRIRLWPPACCKYCKVWSYLYTTAGEAVKKSYLANGGNAKSKPPPLAGLGYGLPLRCGDLLSSYTPEFVIRLGDCFFFFVELPWLSVPRQLHFF